MLLPPSIDELIEVNHPVLTVNSVIDSIDLSELLKAYKGGGTSSYHPRMLLKVLVYSYLSNTYSSRKIEEGLKRSKIDERRQNTASHFCRFRRRNEPCQMKSKLSLFLTDSLVSNCRRILIQTIIGSPQ